MKALTYVEIDVDFCSLTYGVSPCTAALGVTGAIKCFNSLVTCQDRVNFANAPVTLRFAIDTNYLPKDIEAIPSIKGVSFSPATISLGENLGQRATLTVNFEDHRHSDTGPGFDKYLSERPYDPYLQGSFWGKFRARQPFLRGRPLRLIRGLLGQSLAQMETRHYVIESFDGPTPQGTYTLIAKDVLKLADDDRAQAPRLSNGFLISALTDTDTSATLSPSGIGDLEYPASGHVAIGGEEICAFTRLGDVLTLTRGQLGTLAASHDSQDRVQLVLRYVGQDPANIISDLLQIYAGVDAAFIPVANWLNETQSFLQRVYTATIAEPTGVNTLVSELIEQAALAMWWDDRNQEIRLQVLRAISTTAARFTGANTLEGALRIKEQPNTRLSQIWTYFGQRNALQPVDETDNYRSALLTVDGQAETDYGTPAIRKIFSRWIPAFGRQTAERLNNIQLGRFRDPPRRFNFETFRYGAEIPVLGGGYRVEAWPIQDDTGAATNAPIQVTRLNPQADRFSVEAEEMLFQVLDPVDLTNRTIIIDSDFNDFNLRAVHDSIFPAPTGSESPSITITCIIDPNVIVGSTNTATPAFDVGDWPVGIPISIEVKGRIQGAGGQGGGAATTTGYVPSQVDGKPGGPAFFTRFPVNVDVTLAEIFGGGGGGGGGRIKDGGKQAGSGGGGAGRLPGQPGAKGHGGENTIGQPGTTEQGGQGGPAGTGEAGGGGRGGDPGLPGADTNISGRRSFGGAAGPAIDGVSFITKTGTGDIRGAEIN